MNYLNDTLGGQRRPPNDPDCDAPAPGYERCEDCGEDVEHADAVFVAPLSPLCRSCAWSRVGDATDPETEDRE